MVYRRPYQAVKLKTDMVGPKRTEESSNCFGQVYEHADRGQELKITREPHKNAPLGPRYGVQMCSEATGCCHLDLLTCGILQHLFATSANLQEKSG